MQPDACTVCGQPAKRSEVMHGWCPSCYNRWLRLGKPEDGPGLPRKGHGAPVEYEGPVICRTCKVERPHTDFYIREPGKFRRTDCRFCMHERHRAYVDEAGKADMRRDRLLRRKYGITSEDFAALVVKQGGRCAICRQVPEVARTNPRTGRRWTNFHVDHDHVTGVTRGLLCVRCNSTLGHIEALGWHAFRQYLDVWDSEAVRHQ